MKKVKFKKLEANNASKALSKKSLKELRGGYEAAKQDNAYVRNIVVPPTR